MFQVISSIVIIVLCLFVRDSSGFQMIDHSYPLKLIVIISLVIILNKWIKGND